VHISRASIYSHHYGSFEITSMEIDLSGKRAVVAGGAGAIGLAISKTLASAGALVTVLDKNLEGLKGNDYLKGVEVDLTRIEDIRIAVGAMAKEGLHIVVHPAGVNLHKAFADVTEDDWDLICGVNLKSAFFLTQAAVPIMRKSGGGSIVLVSSCSAKLGYPGLTDYCATKGGIEAMMRGLACELAPDIRVNAIAPGTTKTPMTKGLWGTELRHRAHAATIPMGRLAAVDEQANACLFLVSDLARYITGAVLPVDGGLTALQADFIDLKLRKGNGDEEIER